MKIKDKSKFMVRLMCCILAALMVIGMTTYVLYYIAGVHVH